MPWPCDAQNPGPGLRAGGEAAGAGNTLNSPGHGPGMTTQCPGLTARPPASPLPHSSAGVHRDQEAPPPPVRAPHSHRLELAGSTGCCHVGPGQGAKVPVPLTPCLRCPRTSLLRLGALGAARLNRTREGPPRPRPRPPAPKLAPSHTLMHTLTRLHTCTHRRSVNTRKWVSLSTALSLWRGLWRSHRRARGMGTDSQPRPRRHVLQPIPEPGPSHLGARSPSAQHPPTAPPHTAAPWPPPSPKARAPPASTVPRVPFLPWRPAWCPCHHGQPGLTKKHRAVAVSCRSEDRTGPLGPPPGPSCPVPSTASAGPGAEGSPTAQAPPSEAASCPGSWVRCLAGRGLTLPPGSGPPVGPGSAQPWESPDNTSTPKPAVLTGPGLRCWADQALEPQCHRSGLTPLPSASVSPSGFL